MKRELFLKMLADAERDACSSLAPGHMHGGRVRIVHRLIDNQGRIIGNEEEMTCGGAKSDKWLKAGHPLTGQKSAEIAPICLRRMRIRTIRDSRSDAMLYACAAVGDCHARLRTATAKGVPLRAMSPAEVGHVGPAPQGRSD